MVCNTIREILVQAEEKFGTEDAIRYKLKKNVIEAKSYTQLKNDSESFSRVLVALGEQGGHIALSGATSYEWIVAYLGIVNSSSVAVPLDFSLPASDMCELIDRADVTVLILDESRNDIAQAAKKQCPKLKYIISIQKSESDENALSFWKLIGAHSGKFDNQPNPDQLCTIMFTSGTTGKSKGVMLTHGNLAQNATCLDMKIEPRTVLLSVLPVHHAYCLSMDILKGLSLGSIICINDSLLRVAKNIKLFKPNMILMVPLMIETIAKKLEDAKGVPAFLVKKQVLGGQLHTICSGGAYLNPSLIDLFKKYGITILQGYGMTECSPVISTNLPWKIKKNSVGKLMPNCEAKVVDEIICVKGSSVMSGYYNMPEETAETLKDGWLVTGDIGYVDEDGYVFLTGRKKNLIITKNGENVSPEEIENKISENRLVQEILVRDSEGIIEAVIFPDCEYAKKKKITDIQTALQSIIDKYNLTVSAYKRVYRLTVRDTEFDKTPSKKIKRY